MPTTEHPRPAQSQASVAAKRPASPGDSIPAENESVVAARSARAAIARAITELDDTNICSLHAFLQILEANEGNASTPIEYFLETAVVRWKWALDRNQGLTPDDLEDMINGEDGCREWFNDLIRTTQLVNAKYARLLAGEKNGADTPSDGITPESCVAKLADHGLPNDPEVSFAF